MNQDGKQPERTKRDGPMGVVRLDNEDLELYAATDGRVETMTISPFNAWRLLASLAFMLDVKLPAKVEKGIKL